MSILEEMRFELWRKLKDWDAAAGDSSLARARLVGRIEGAGLALDLLDCAIRGHHAPNGEGRCHDCGTPMPPGGEQAAPASAPPASVLQSAVDVCQCCGDALEPTPQLCDVCAPTFTEYSDGSAFCDRHEPEDDDCEDGEE